MTAEITTIPHRAQVQRGNQLLSNYVRQLPRPTTVNGSIAVVRVDETIESEFLYHFVNGDEFQYLIALKKAGLGVPHLFQADLRKFDISLPPLAEQRKIARILTTLDSLIEKTEALIDKYQAIRQGMMHDLYTRGVDNHGQLRLSQSEAPDLYKHSALGWIPKEWEVRSLSTALLVMQYGTSSPSQSSGSTPVLRIPNITKGELSLDDLQYQTPSLFDSECYDLADGDILIIRTNGNPRIVGTCAMVANWPLPMLFASYLIRIRVNQDCLSSAFLASFFSTDRARGFIDRRATTSAGNYNINTESLRAMPIPFPPIAEQRHIFEIIDQQNKAIDNEKSHLSKLQQLKLGLMQDLLTGKVQVSVDVDEKEETHHG